MFNKYKVVKVNELNYTLENNNNLYNIVAIFNVYIPKVGDFIYMYDTIITDNTLLEFGDLNTNDRYVTDKDIIKIYHDNQTVTLQRYYG